MDNSINFKGAFWLKQPTNKINSIMTNIKDKKVINNILQEGDVLYITSKDADKKVADFLENNKTKFKYFKIDLTEKPVNEIKKFLIETQTNVITTVSELKDYLNNTLEKCMKTLDLNAKDYDIKYLDGWSEIYTKDREKKLVAIISDPGQNGFRYARLEPKNTKDNVKRYAIKSGEKFSYINNPDEPTENATSDFLKNFFKSVKANKVIHT